LLGEIDRYGEALGHARGLVATGDGEGLVALFRRASSARRAWELRRTLPIVEDKG